MNSITLNKGKAKSGVCLLNGGLELYGMLESGNVSFPQVDGEYLLSPSGMKNCRLNKEAMK